MTQLNTIKDAAKQIGIEYRQLLSACNEGLVPTYKLRKSRCMVCVKEIVEIMKQVQS